MQIQKNITFPNQNNSLCWIVRADEIDGVVYVGKNGFNKQCIVIITGRYAHRLPISEPAYDEAFFVLEAQLSIQIDKQELLSTITDSTILYRKGRNKNYSISEEDDTDIDGIIMDIDGHSHTLDWRTSYNDLKELVSIEEQYTPQQVKYLQLENCQVFGLQLARLNVFYNKQNANYPIEGFHTHLYDDG